jgi:hypothetical protein
MQHAAVIHCTANPCAHNHDHPVTVFAWLANLGHDANKR